MEVEVSVRVFRPITSSGNSKVRSRTKSRVFASKCNTSVNWNGRDSSLVRMEPVRAQPKYDLAIQ